MDVDSIDAVAEAAMGLQQADLQMKMNTALLRKALDSQEAQAQALLAALPQPPQSSPQVPGLGRYVDVYA